MEIIAFVGSVGRVALPYTEGEEEVLGGDYLELLRGVTREEVDKEITRCPHKETSTKMEEVSGQGLFSFSSWQGDNVPFTDAYTFLGYSSRKSTQRLIGRNHHLCHPQLPPRPRRASLRQARGGLSSRHDVHPLHESL